MSVALLESLPKSRLKALLDQFGQIEDPREPWRVAHPLPEGLLLVVCGTICDCEDYDLIAEWGEEHLNRVYFEKRSFSSSGSRVSLTQRRSAMTKGSRFRRASKSATRRVRSSALAWQW